MQKATLFHDSTVDIRFSPTWRIFGTPAARRTHPHRNRNNDRIFDRKGRTDGWKEKKKMTTILLCAPTRRSRWALCMLFFSTKKTEPKQMHVVGCYDRTREKFSRPLRDAVGRAIFFRSPFSYEKIYSVALLSPVSTWTAATGYFWFSLTDIPAWLCLFVCFIDLVVAVCDPAKFTICN